MWSLTSWPHRCNASQQLYISVIIWSFSIYYHRHQKSKSLTPFPCQRKYRHKHILCYTSVFLSFLWSSFQFCEFGRCKSVLDIERHVSLLPHCTLLFPVILQDHSVDFLWTWIRTQLLMSSHCLRWERGSFIFVFGHSAWWTVSRCGQPRTPGFFMVWVGQKMLGIMVMGGGGGDGWAVRLAARLVVSWCVHERPILVIVGLGPELLL